MFAWGSGTVMSATGSGYLKVRELGHRRHRSNSDPQATAEALAQLRLEDGPKCGNSNMRTGSLGSNSRLPHAGGGASSGGAVEVSKHASRLATLSRLFKPWKWKRKKKSDKFEQTSRTLERKISMRSTKEELIQRGVLLSDRELGSPTQKVASSLNLRFAAMAERNRQLAAAAGDEPSGPPPPAAAVLSPCAQQQPVRQQTPLPPRQLVPPEGDEEDSDDSAAAAGDAVELRLGLDSAAAALVEEIPAKEPPQSSALPRKSALKKQQVNGAHATQQQLSAAQARLRPTRIHLSPGAQSPLPPGLPLHEGTNKENQWPPPPASGGGHAAEDDDEDGPINWRDYYGDDEQGRLAAKIARKDSLALKLAQRPDRQELIDKNILQMQSDRERQESREAVGNKLTRRLSLRPTPEELEQRNILKFQTAEELKKEKEQKKKVLIRKLSFRPTIEELKERKIIRFNDYVEVTQAQDYDRRADKPWTRLTPKDKAAIRKELNEFKSMEMQVHEDSRHLTRFHRP
ncbi:phosphatase and actin regulator 1 isoform X9 [Haemaphysalis longicornis]